eukprot:gene5708-9528_t
MLLSTKIKNATGTGKNKPWYFQDNLTEIRTCLQDGVDFEYSSNDNRYYSAYLLLNLWEYLLSVIEEINLEERILSLDVIVKILSRRTFDPFYMDGNDKEEFSIGFFSKNIQKGQLTLKYKQLLYRTYSFVITKLQLMKEFTEKPEYISFSASVLALGCYRIPNGMKVAESFSKMKINEKQESNNHQNHSQNHSQKDLEIEVKVEHPIEEEEEEKEELTKEENKIEQKDENKIQNVQFTPKVSQNQMSRLFRFEKFYTNLKTCKEEKSIQELLQKCSDWIPDINSHHNFFQTFLAEFTSQISQILFTDIDIQFDQMPYYSNLIEIFFSLCNVPIHLNSVWFQLSLVLLSQNHLLLTKLIFINFTSARIFNTQEVLSSIDRVDQLCQCLIKWPINFDYDFFKQVVEKLFSLDHYQIVTRTLIFIYNNLDLFFGQQRKDFIQNFLLKNFFFDLFCHWNYDIRMCFHRIILFKIQRIWKKSIVNIPTEGKQNIQKEIISSTSNTFKISKQKIKPKKPEDLIYINKLNSFLKSKENFYKDIFYELTIEKQNEEEVLDEVLKSKVDSYIFLMKNTPTKDISVETKRKEKYKKDKNDDDLNELLVPFNFRPYINMKFGNQEH